MPNIYDPTNPRILLNGETNKHYIYTTGLPYFTNRIPFEALANPDEHLSGYTVCDLDPDPRGNTGLINQLVPTSDNRYKLMVNNFLAEVPRFF